MSFQKYLESKICPKAVIVMDAYKEKLYADMSSLLLKPDDRLNEAKKQTVNIQEISKILAELNYPLRDEFCIAIRSGSAKQVWKVHGSFKKYGEYANLDQKLMDKVENILFNYQAKLHVNEFGADDADEVIKSSIDESHAILNQMAKNIDLAISKISDWHNHSVVIEAMNPQQGWVITEAKINVGESFKANFVYEKTATGFKIKDVSENELPASLKNDMQQLLAKLQNNSKYNKILTLYMNRPLSERRYFELAKRDLSLGLEVILPNHIELTTDILLDEMDIWKVRVEEKYLRENNGKYCIVGDEAPMRWIELYKRKENE